MLVILNGLVYYVITMFSRSIQLLAWLTYWFDLIFSLYWIDHKSFCTVFTLIYWSHCFILEIIGDLIGSISFQVFYSWLDVGFVCYIYVLNYKSCWSSIICCDYLHGSWLELIGWSINRNESVITQKHYSFQDDLFISNCLRILWMVCFEAYVPIRIRSSYNNFMVLYS